MKNPEFTLKLPNDIQYLTVVLGYVRKIAELAGFSPREQQELEIATEEAVTNVIRHAFAPGEVSTYTVRCELTPVSMVVAVHDQGIPFDSRLIPEFSPTNNLEEITGAGLGGS
ncbi:MAG: ATP-binding protein [Bacillota bacterium]